MNKRVSRGQTLQPPLRSTQNYATHSGDVSHSRGAVQCLRNVRTDNPYPCSFPAPSLLPCSFPLWCVVACSCRHKTIQNDILVRIQVECLWKIFFSCSSFKTWRILWPLIRSRPNRDNGSMRPPTVTVTERQSFGRAPAFP